MAAYEEVNARILAGEYKNTAEYPAKDDPDRPAKLRAHDAAEAKRIACFREDLEIAYGTQGQGLGPWSRPRAERGAVLVFRVFRDCEVNRSCGWRREILRQPFAFPAA